MGNKKIKYFENVKKRASARFHWPIQFGAQSSQSAELCPVGQGRKFQNTEIEKIFESEIEKSQFFKAVHRQKIILGETLGDDISRRQGKLIRARQVNIIGAQQVNISGNQRRWRSGGQFSPLAPCTPPPAGMTLHLEKIAAKKTI